MKNGKPVVRSGPYRLLAFWPSDCEKASAALLY
jgi:hypothetical protein